jgi:hypothetical protein
MTKTITFWDTVIISAINAAIVGLLDLALGADTRHPAFSDMWWCFFGGVNIYLMSAPSTVQWIKSKLRAATNRH